MDILNKQSTINLPQIPVVVVRRLTFDATSDHLHGLGIGDRTPFYILRGSRKTQQDYRGKPGHGFVRSLLKWATLYQHWSMAHLRVVANYCLTVRLRNNFPYFRSNLTIFERA